MSLDSSANSRSSYPTYKSNIPPHARPANFDAKSSVAGGKPECAMVTAFNGSKLCTILRLFPSFLATVNQRDLYDAFEGSYTPASIFLCNILQTWSYMPGGMGIFL